MDSEKLLAFLSVVESQSFSKGAESLHINQPTLSARIRALENELGVELFERNKGKGVRLTNYGRLFVPYAKSILKMMHESKERLSAEKENNITIRVGTSVYGNYLLPQFFGKFHREIPNLEISVVSGYTPEIVEMLRNGIVDIGFVNDVVPFDGLEHVRLIEQELLLICSPDYLEEYTDPMPFSRLLDKTLIIFGKRENYEKKRFMAPIIHEYMEQHGYQFKNTMYIDQIEPLKSLIKDGHGLTFLPPIVIEPELARNEFIKLSIIPPIRPMGLHMVCMNEQKHPAIRKIKKLVLDHFCQNFRTEGQ